MGGVVHPRDRPRGRSPDPRDALGDPQPHRRAAGGGRGDGGARRLSWRLRRRPDRGHGRGHDRRMPAPHAHPEGSLMAAISTNDFKTGMTLQLDNGLWSIVDFQHVKPGKGGAFVRSRLKNVRTGQVVDRTFNAGVRVEQAMIDKRDMQFLYRDGDDYVFMDNESYEQMHVPPKTLGGAQHYLVEQMTANVQMFDAEIVGLDLPAAVELTIAETEPGIQGDRVSGAKKPATLQTGLVIQVPLFVNIGDRVKVDTRTGEYITRV